MVKNNESVDVSEADKIWEEIKGKTLNLYALSNQTVSDHVKKLAVPGQQLLVKLNASAVLPALETALGDKFEVEASDDYTIVRRAAPKVDTSKLVEKK